MDGFLKCSENNILGDMASYLRKLGCQYREDLPHSSHTCLMIHIMFHSGGLTW